MLANITVENWQAVVAGLAVLLPMIGKFWYDFLKDRREREDGKARLDALLEIARSNSNIREGQIEQNGKLSAVMKVNEAHHAELIRALQTTCRLNGAAEQKTKL